MTTTASTIYLCNFSTAAGAFSTFQWWGASILYFFFFLWTGLLRLCLATTHSVCKIAKMFGSLSQGPLRLVTTGTLLLDTYLRFYDNMPKVTKCPSMTKCPKSICPNDILPNHDKMPKLIKCPKDILPKMTICPKSHFAQGDKLPKLSLWQSAIFVTYSPKFS